jgi:hypothetical protein
MAAEESNESLSSFNRGGGAFRRDMLFGHRFSRGGVSESVLALERRAWYIAIQNQRPARRKPSMPLWKRLFGRETIVGPAPQSAAAVITSRPAPPAETAPSAGPDQWISTLLEYEFRNDILSDKPYWEAANALVALGGAAVPRLMRHLGESWFIAAALGKIGTRETLAALGGELRSEDWRRVEAAARGLGISKNPDAIPILESARGSRAETTIAEVHHAFNWALGELQHAKAGDKWLEVDKDRVWQQIMMVSSQLQGTIHDATKRNGVIRWYEEMKDVLPGARLVVPGRDFSPADAKSRAWSMLATIIYYAKNPDKSSFSVPCQEAKYCWEQALKLMPGDSYFTGCLRDVS